MGQMWVNWLPRAMREQIIASPLLQKLVSNTGWLFADRMLRMGVGLVVAIWLSRYLGPAQFGFYSYLLAIVALMSPLATLGMDNIVVRDLVAAPAQAAQILGSAFVVRLLGGVGVLVGSVAVIGLLRPFDQAAQSLIAIIAAGTIVQALDVTDLWFQSQTRSSCTVIAKSSAFMLASLARIGFILAEAPLGVFIWVGLAEVVIGAVGSAVAYWHVAMPLTNWKPTRGMLRQLFCSSWPLLLSSIAIIIYMKLDVIMLNQMQGEQATGIYAAALRISEVWYFIPIAIVASVTPTMIAARKNEPKIYFRRLEQLFVLMAILTLGLAIPITLLAYPIVLILFGEQYSDASTVLAIHIWSAVFVFLGVAQSIWDVAEDLTRLALFRTVCGALINIVLNLLLIPAFSATGAAIATAVSYACSAWLLNALHFQSRGVFFMQSRALLLLPLIKRVK